MTLDGIENVAKKSNSWHTPEIGHQRYGTHVIRYADDFVVTCKSKEALEGKVLPAIELFLKERGLLLSKEKTKIIVLARKFRQKICRNHFQNLFENSKFMYG